MSLSENLQRLRKEKGLSQEDVAQKLFVSRQSVSKWENGNAEPGVENLMALAKLYGVTLDELVGNEPAEGFQFVEEKLDTNNTSSSDRLYYGLVAFRAVWVLLVGVVSLISTGVFSLPLDLPAMVVGIWVTHPAVWVVILCLQAFYILLELAILFFPGVFVTMAAASVLAIALMGVCVLWLTRPRVRTRFFKK